MRQRIYSGGPLEKKIGYCRATRVGNLVFVSGSTAMKDGQVVGAGDPAAQTRQALATIGRHCPRPPGPRRRDRGRRRHRQRDAG